MKNNSNFFAKKNPMSHLKIYIYGLNSCGMRNVRLFAYKYFLLCNGHKIVDIPKEADVILIWTCGFRSDMRDNSISEIKRCIEEYNSEVVVAGCLPDIDRDYLNSYFNGRVIPWLDDETLMEEFFGAPRMKLADVPLVLYKEQQYEDEVQFRKKNPHADVPYIGRYIQVYIAEGCPWECSYCSERLAFPPFKSYPEDDIIKTVCNEIERSGKKKVVLLADSVGDYGTDTESSLPKLIYRLVETVPGIKIAIQNLNPYHFLKFYDDIIQFIKMGIIIHFQIPYQSANDRILKLMARPYTKSDLEKVFSALYELDFKEIDSHIIVGFPGETDKEFQESVEFAIKYHIKYMLINGFMEALGMPAGNLPDKIDTKTKLKRLQYAEKRLRERGIIANSDYSSIAGERFQRLNNLKRD